MRVGGGDAWRRRRPWSGCSSCSGLPRAARAARLATPGLRRPRALARSRRRRARCAPDRRGRALRRSARADAPCAPRARSAFARGAGGERADRDPRKSAAPRPARLVSTRRSSPGGARRDRRGAPEPVRRRARGYAGRRRRPSPRRLRARPFAALRPRGTDDRELSSPGRSRYARCARRFPPRCDGISRAPSGSAVRSRMDAWCAAPVPGASPAPGGRPRNASLSITSTFKAKTVWWFGCASTTSAANGRSMASTIKRSSRSAIQCATSRARTGAFPGGPPCARAHSPAATPARRSLRVLPRLPQATEAGGIDHPELALPRAARDTSHPRARPGWSSSSARHRGTTRAR